MNTPEPGRRRRVAIACLAALSLAGALADPAGAAFPGQAGKIAFIGSDTGRLTTAYENGGGATAVTPPGFDVRELAWSADGRRLVFAALSNGQQVWVVDEDGANLTQLTTDGSNENPSWSPDGTKIAFDRYSLGDPHPNIYVMDSDGTDATPIAAGVHPTWSPDGSKIAYSTNGTSPNGYGSDIRVVNPDGSGDALLVAQPSPADSSYQEPDWSPDGAKVAFVNNSRSSPGIHAVASDGSGHVQLTAGAYTNPAWSPDGYFILTDIAFNQTIWKMSSSGGFIDRLPFKGFEPAWQPVLGSTGHVRPKAATPLDVSLVIAYQDCIDPNLRHGPPLGEDSCGPPQPVSPYLTVGTADSNGQPTNSRGRVRLKVMPGDPGTAADEADVAITVDITDVRRADDLSDYTGEVWVQSGLRLVDRTNSGSPPAATMVDTAFAFAVPCAGTAGTTIGGRCNVETTADSLVPGVVAERARAVWQLGEIRVFDGGADDDAETAADNTLFATQGIFVP